MAYPPASWAQLAPIGGLALLPLLALDPGLARIGGWALLWSGTGVAAAASAFSGPASRIWPAVVAGVAGFGLLCQSAGVGDALTLLVTGYLIATALAKLAVCLVVWRPGELAWVALTTIGFLQLGLALLVVRGDATTLELTAGLLLEIVGQLILRRNRRPGRL